MKERPVQFGSGGSLAGTICRVAESTISTRTGLLLLNAGTIHRIGPHRMNVKLAREAARLGVPSIRFDLTGLGDSGPMGRSSYQEQACADISSAASVLCKEEGVDQVVLFGICSGADDGYHAAQKNHAISGLILFDPWVYPTLRWRARLMFGKVLGHGLKGSLARIRSDGSKALLQRDTEIFSALSNYGRELPEIGAYGRQLKEFTDRGVRVHLVYSASTVDAADYKEQRRKVIINQGLDGLVSSEFLPNVDHVITSLEAQRTVLARLPDWLGVDHKTRPEGQTTVLESVT